MQKSDRAQLDRRLRVAEVEVAKSLCMRIGGLLGDAFRAGTETDRAAIRRAMLDIKRIPLNHIDAVDGPAAALECVRRHHPAVAARVAAQVGITLTPSSATE